MKSLTICLIIASVALVDCTDKNSSKQPTSHLSYKADSLLNMPVVFKQQTFSTDLAESYITFSPDGKTAYFRRAPEFAFGVQTAIYETRYSDGEWSTPAVASFSGKYSDSAPFVTPDGKRLFFTSNRPVEMGAEPKQDKDIWYVDKEKNGWGTPIHLSAISSSSYEESPVVTGDGTLYFSSARDGGQGSGDLYKSEFVDGEYQSPVNLGEAINSSHGEWNCIVDREKKFIIFESSGRDENMSRPGDLYISYHRDGTWTPAKNLEMINSVGSDAAPRLSPDGQYLFFASNRSSPNKTDLYQISLSIISSKD